MASLNVYELLSAILHELKAIRKVVCRPVEAKIHFAGEEIGMPGQMTDVQSVTAQIAETDAAGQPVTIADSSKVTWTIADPSIADLTVDAASGIATFKAKAVGTSSVGVTDGSNGLAAQDTLTVTSGPATSLLIKFGTPA